MTTQAAEVAEALPIWECIDNHGHYFTTNSLTAIGQHVIAFWLLDTSRKQNNESKGETDYG